MLEALDLTCVRGDRLLFRGLGFRLAPGEILQVEGENGAGKTSLLRIVAGLGLPSAGEVRWNDRPIQRDRDAYGRALLYLGHLGALKEELTPEENLLSDSRTAGLARIGQEQVLDALARSGLQRVARLPVRVLSAGQRRRTALARLLLSPPPLWILDEPFNALDADALVLLRQVLKNHVQAGGLVLLTSHQPPALDGVALRALRLSP